MTKFHRVNYCMRQNFAVMRKNANLKGKQNLSINLLISSVWAGYLTSFVSSPVNRRTVIILAHDC